MNKVQNQIPIKQIFIYVLVNKSIVLSVLILSLMMSYLYNSHFKDIKYDFFIKIENRGFINTYTGEVVILENSAFSKNISSISKGIISEELLNYNQIFDTEINFSEAENISLVYFSSYKKQNTKTFIDNINMSLKKILEKNSKDLIIKTQRQLNNLAKTYLDSENPEIVISSFSLNNRLQNDIFYFENFLTNVSKTKNLNYFFSLNGWEIEDNNLKISEQVVAGLIFGILFNFIVLFFSSKYFRKNFL